MAAKTAPALSTLDDVFAAIGQEDREHVEVPMRELADGAPDITLTWRAPDAVGIYRITTDIEALREKCPDWPDYLLLDIASLARCHVAPSPGKISVALFYAGIAQKNASLFSALLQRMWLSFPLLDRTNMGRLEKKESSVPVSAGETPIP